MKKKLLAIGHSLCLAQNRDVLRALHNSGSVEVTILAPRFFHGDLRDLHLEDEPSGSTMTVLPIDCYWTSRIHFFSYNLKQVDRALSQKHFDAVYLWEEPYIVAGFTLAHLFHRRGIPYFFYSCQNILKNYPWPFSYFEGRAQKHAAGIYGCGFGVREVLSAKNIPSAYVLPFFVSLERFHPAGAQQKSAGLQKLGLKASFTIGFMGRLVEEKGIGLFCEVADKLCSESPCNIIVVGSGPFAGELKKWSENRSYIRLLELKHHEVPEVLPLMDVLLCPSQTRANWKEQFGRMIVEGFASGVVVVGSDSGEIPYVIGDAGVVLGESDRDGWIAAVRELKDNPEKRAHLAQKGFARAQMYSVENVAKDLRTSLSAILDRN